MLDKRQGFISAIEITNPGSGYSTALAPVTVEVRVGCHVVLMQRCFVRLDVRPCVLCT